MAGGGELIGGNWPVNRLLFADIGTHRYSRTFLLWPEHQHMKEAAKFHLGEGIKLATEAIKMLFFLNGAATISVITFIGNLKQLSGPLVFAMQLFAIGAALAPVALVLGYLSQLYFGTAEPAFNPKERRLVAGVVHYSVYGTMFASWVSFLAGARYAAIGFESLHY
jgi:multisubunit Na+/H+ antiporter MnhC subunit